MAMKYSSLSALGLDIPLGDGKIGQASACYDLQIAVLRDGIKLRLADAYADEEIALIETDLIEAGGTSIFFTGAKTVEDWRPFVESDLTIGLQGDSLRLCANQIASLDGLINTLGVALGQYFTQRNKNGAIRRRGGTGLAVHVQGVQRGTAPQVSLTPPKGSSAPTLFGQGGGGGNSSGNSPIHTTNGQSGSGAQAQSTPQPAPQRPRPTPAMYKKQGPLKNWF